MPTSAPDLGTTDTAQAWDASSHARHFGGADGLLPLWIAEPYLPLAPSVEAAIRGRANVGWYGYETRAPRGQELFWDWMHRRHDWSSGGLETIVSPSIGTSIGVLLEAMTEEGAGVILQPPVFTDFKPLIASANRRLVKNPLRLDGERYEMDMDGLRAVAADPATTAMILCNPHNPVGRVWTREELAAVASVCAEHDVFVIADEIHADLALTPARFVPFGSVATGSGVRWAALHGPIKTFGLAGVCDTLLITDDERVSEVFRSRSSKLHLTRNNVFGLAAFEAGYAGGEAWLDEVLGVVARNVEILEGGLPGGISVVRPEGTYLAWLDLRGLGMEVPQLAEWLWAKAGLALSPGHWFGREGAGFARMTIAAPTEVIEAAVGRLRSAVG